MDKKNTFVCKIKFQMLHIKLLLIFSFFANCLCAQDIITYKNGDEIKAKVIEVNENEIKYKKWDNQNGVTYGVSVEKIFMIKYENGTKELFSKETESNSTKDKSKSTTKKEETVVNYVYKQEQDKLVNLKRHYVRQGVGCSVFGFLLLVGGFAIIQSNDLISPDGNEGIILGTVVSVASILPLIRVPIAFSKAGQCSKKLKENFSYINISPFFKPFNPTHAATCGIKLQIGF